MRSILRTVVAIAVGAATLQVAPDAQQSPQPGDPLPGLTPDEFEAFRLGLGDFLEVETPKTAWAQPTMVPVAPSATVFRPLGALPP